MTGEQPGEPPIAMSPVPPPRPPEGRRWIRRTLAALGLVALVGGARCVNACFRVMEYRIPASYQGPVVVLFEEDSCRALRREGWSTVVDVDEHGFACTSNDAPGFRFTAGLDTYLHVSAEGTQELDLGTRGAGGRIWRKHAGTCRRAGGPERVYEAFSVGPEASVPATEPSPCVILDGAPP